MTPDPSAVPVVVWITGTDFDTFAEVSLVFYACVLFLLAAIAVIAAYRSRA